jgi:hypothetical protein
MSLSIMKTQQDSQFVSHIHCFITEFFATYTLHQMIVNNSCQQKLPSWPFGIDTTITLIRPRSFLIFTPQVSTGVVEVFFNHLIVTSGLLPGKDKFILSPGLVSDTAMQLSAATH